MALFDKINSRYTKSMEDGGSYERDAAIGGYDRKELRGLSKQARGGTLTQRERARYKLPRVRSVVVEEQAVLV